MFRISIISTSATFVLSSDAVIADEGTQFTIFLTTTGVQDGQPIPYTISGTVVPEDFVGTPSFTGNFIVVNGGASLTLTAKIDAYSEPTEKFTLSLDTFNKSIDVDVNNIPGTAWDAGTTQWDSSVDYWDVPA